METPNISSSSFLWYFIRFLVLVCLILCSLETCFTLEESDVKSHLGLEYSHTVQVKSLLPATTCSPSTQGHDKKASVLKVVHKHGPCSHFNQSHKENAPTHTQILGQDQARVNSIHSRRNPKKAIDRRGQRQRDSTTVPALSGSTVGAGDYIVTVGLGTPKKQLSLTFDTGSDLTWTQCRPCIRPCYKQVDPIFDPSVSSSYANVSCNSVVCSQLKSGTGYAPACATSTCVYTTAYGDGSISVGFFAKETITLTSTDVFDGFLFGCGKINQGLFRGSAGLLGLGRDSISFVEQTAAKYGRFFSYCLPSTSSSTGFLSFGREKRGRASKGVKFTRLATLPQKEYSSLYGINLVGITVGGRKLPISISVFKTSGTIIDSGTVITRLPPQAYSALRAAFQQGMKSYPRAPAISILDTCYDFSSYETVNIPKIAISFKGGLTLDLDGTGIIYPVTASQACLAFAANKNDSDIAVFGNVQQLKLEVVYDVDKGKLGFASGGCL
ncbi:PREDICTED: aspartyl protease [Prunus dulcis]|uniref:PREDICTED: aspartyl protease n=1 Tax=Prunus dulcis TaxID=3755 RepID=A0A5E4FJT7_PRUDU|nr:aspartyl protease family protein At5g10770-like [Prunus dulcis]VVA28072.1 PREDICTED: aspartyl protease [Prunus dulcis]